MNYIASLVGARFRCASAVGSQAARLHRAGSVAAPPAADSRQADNNAPTTRTNLTI
jgi:hypothetical protein